MLIVGPVLSEGGSCSCALRRWQWVTGEANRSEFVLLSPKAFKEMFCSSASETSTLLCVASLGILDVLWEL